MDIVRRHALTARTPTNVEGDEDFLPGWAKSASPPKSATPKAVLLGKTAAIVSEPIRSPLAPSPAPGGSPAGVYKTHPPSAAANPPAITVAAPSIASIQLDWVNSAEDDVPLDGEVDLDSAGSYDELQKMLMAQGLTDFVEKSYAEKRAEFSKDCTELRERLRKRRGFINPRWKYVQYWDLLTAFALLYTCTVTPFEVGAGLKTSFGPLYAVNTVINLIFVGDIFLQFVLPVIDQRVGDNATLVRDHGRLAWSYFRSWFFIDVFTVLPFDTVTLVAPALFGGACGMGGSGVMVKGIKLIRIARLFKLLRMLRASRLLARWDTRISVSSTTRSMVTAWTGWAIAMHWLACLWMLLPQLQGSWREDTGVAMAIEAQMALVAADPSLGTCTACTCDVDNGTMSDVCASPCLTDCEIAMAASVSGLPLANIRNGQSWYCRAVGKGWVQPDFADMPFTMWTFALSKVFGGLGPLGTSDTAESVLITVSSLGLRISFAILQGLIMKVLTQGNPEETKYRQSLDKLNAMMRDQRIPNAVRRKARDFFKRSKQLTKRMSYFGLIDSTVSTKLKSDLRVLMSSNTFDNIPWLYGCEPEFLGELAKKATREAYAMEEAIPNMDAKGNLRLVILVDGVACRGGAILTVGASWGDIQITQERLRDTRPAKALTFCELVVLGRDALESLLPRFPISEKIVRQSALKLGTQRMMVVLAMVAKLEMSSGKLAPGSAPMLAGAPRSAVETLGGASRKGASPSTLLHKVSSSPSSPSSPPRLRSGPPEVGGTSAASALTSEPVGAVMARLDKMESTMQLMLQKMLERDERDAASRAAWLAPANDPRQGNRLAA